MQPTTQPASKRKELRPLAATIGSEAVEGLTREQFGQLPRIMQWALAGKYGVPRVERVRDARQERISWSLGKTPGGTGGDPAPHSFYTDDRDLFTEILAARSGGAQTTHLGRQTEPPNEKSSNSPIKI